MDLVEIGRPADAELLELGGQRHLAHLVRKFSLADALPPRNRWAQSSKPLILSQSGHPNGGSADRYPRSRTYRFSALTTPRNDACTIDSLMPTPHCTLSPTSISR